MESNVTSFDTGYRMGRDHILELVKLVLDSGVSNRQKVRQVEQLIKDEPSERKRLGL